MRLLIDQDQVLCDWKGRVVQYWNEDTGENLDQDRDCKHWDTAQDLGYEKGGGHFIRSVMRHPDFYTNLEPLPGAIEGLAFLRDQGHELRIVSSVPKQAAIAYHGKLEWLRKHVPWFDLDHFYAVKHKHEVKGDVLIDDGCHNIGPFSAQGGQGILFGASYNKEPVEELLKYGADMRNVMRVEDWFALTEFFGNQETFRRLIEEARERGAREALASTRIQGYRPG